MRRIVLAVAVLMTACGAPQGIALGTSAAASDTDEDSEPVVCGAETSTGTNINRVVCRKQADVDNDRRAARDWRSRNGADPHRRR
jgi:hypothetical protein